jgi:hypothetical protein
MHQPTH